MLGVPKILTRKLKFFARFKYSDQDFRGQLNDDVKCDPMLMGSH